MSFGLVEKPVGTQDLLVYLHRHGRTPVVRVLQDTGMSKETFYKAVVRLKSLEFLTEEEQVGFPTHKFLGLTRAGEAVALAMAPVADLLAATSQAIEAELERLETADEPATAPRRMDLLETLVDRAFRAGRWDPAFQMAGKLAALAAASGAARSEAAGRVALGRLYLKRDAHDDACRELESARALARRAGDDGLLSDAEYLLGSDLERRGRWADAVDRFASAAEAAARANDLRRGACARLGKGRVLGRQGNLEESLRVIQPVVADLEAAAGSDADLAQDLARAYASVGATADRLKRPEAIGWFEKAAEAARRAGDPLLEAHAFLNAGAHWIGAKQFRRAEQILVRARSVFEDLQEHSALTGVEINLGNICRDERRWSEADAHYDRAHALSQATGNRWQQGYVFFNRGTMMKERDRKTEARSLLLEARKIFEDLGSAVLLARSDEELAGLTGPGTR